LAGDLRRTSSDQTSNDRRLAGLPASPQHHAGRRGGSPIYALLSSINDRIVNRRAMVMTLAIETHRLTRYFNGHPAVDGVELAVETGKFYGFLGPNGAGKSTTIKMLTGLLAPSGGQMRVLGRNMLDPREALEAKRRIGVIPEDLALFDNLTARE